MTHAMFFDGFPVYINNFLGWQHESKQVRFPRSKKRRIRKKFAKDSRNYQTRKWQEPVAYKMGGSLIANGAMMSLLKKELPTTSVAVGYPMERYT